LRQLPHWFYKTNVPLTTCPDCQAEISTVAPTCPRCGRPFAVVASTSAKETILTPAAAQGTRLLMLAGLALLLCVVAVLCVFAALALLRTLF